MHEIKGLFWFNFVQRSIKTKCEVKNAQIHITLSTEKFFVGSKRYFDETRNKIICYCLKSKIKKAKFSQKNFEYWKRLKFVTCF